MTQVALPSTASKSLVGGVGLGVILNVHFRTLVPDGVFDLTDTGPARFVPLEGPTDDEVARVLTVIIRKVARALGRDGLLPGLLPRPSEKQPVPGGFRWRFDPSLPAPSGTGD